ncbi:MAG TPA: hypothetical protein VK644_11725 [Chitinophagaceae bacterium]|nr:hypothetical protein [Chitinophagaceae bacterium]
MNRIRPDVDIVNDVLQAVLSVQPTSSFAQSLLKQYQERGGLSKKQLEGIHDKAAKLKCVPEQKLATLEAIIMRKPTRYKSALPAATPMYTRDEALKEVLDRILAKYPQHKRVLFLRSKYENNEILTPAETTELQRFEKLLT